MSSIENTPEAKDPDLFFTLEPETQKSFCRNGYSLQDGFLAEINQSLKQIVKALEKLCDLSSA